MAKKAIIYCRVATHEKNIPLPTALKNQLLDCIRFAQSNEYEVTDIVCEQGSGMVINEKLSWVLEQIKSRHAKTIITLSTFILSRKRLLALEILNKVEKCKGEVRVCNESVSPEVGLTREITLGMNNYYRHQMSESIKRGLAERKRRLQMTAQSK